MEVSIDNFDAELPTVLSAIKEADFLCFDCEFSGIGRFGSDIGAYETPDTIYAKYKENVSNFMLMQFGLCCFRYDAVEKRYVYHAFSFYVFPRFPQKLRGLRNAVSLLTCSVQTDCLDFLASQNFDFNKWIVKGIPYLRDFDAENLKSALAERHDWRKSNAESQQTPNIPDNIKPKINKILKQIQQYIEKSGANAEREPLILTGLNGFERKITYQVLEHKYGNELYLESQTVPSAEDAETGSEVGLVVRKCLTADEHAKLAKKKLDDEQAIIENARGFCKVVSAISQSGKPLIGHNIPFDLLHTLKAFCADLPASLSRFRTLAAECFPTLIDTKVLAAQQPQLKALMGRGMALGDLVRRVKKHPFTPISTIPSNPAYGYASLIEGEGTATKQLHNAAYDAFITGIAFVGMACYVGDYKCPTRNTNDIPWDLVAPFSNKIPTGAAMQDMPYLSLKGPDATPDRAHVFHVTWTRDAEKKWTNADLVQMFSPFGPIRVDWIGNQSAFVTLLNRDQALLVVKSLVTDKKTGNGSDIDTGSMVTVTPVSDYLKDLESKLKDGISGSNAAGKRRVEPSSPEKNGKMRKESDA